MKCNNIRIMGILEGEEREEGIESLYEKIMTENFLILQRGKNIQVQEAQRFSVKMNPERATARHTIIKMPSFKDKVAKEKQKVTYKGALIMLQNGPMGEMIDYYQMDPPSPGVPLY